MGSAKEQMHDNAIGKRDKKLAEHFGISKDEFDLTEFEIDTDDVHQVSLISFSENSPKEILEKIPNLKEGRHVEVDNNVFMEGEFNEEEFSDDFNTSESGFVDIHPDTAKAMADAVRKQNEDK